MCGRSGAFTTVRRFNPRLLGERSLASEETGHWLLTKCFFWEYTAPNRYATTTGQLKRQATDAGRHHLLLLNTSGWTLSRSTRFFRPASAFETRLALPHLPPLRRWRRGGLPTAAHGLRHGCTQQRHS